MLRHTGPIKLHRVINVYNYMFSVKLRERVHSVHGLAEGLPLLAKSSRRLGGAFLVAMAGSDEAIGVGK